MIVLKSCTPPTPNDRLREWRERYDRLPIEMQSRAVRVFDFRPKSEPANPDEYMEMRA